MQRASDLKGNIMSDNHLQETGAVTDSQVRDGQRADLLSASLRRAFQTDLDSPVPDHLQRLVDALQRSLSEPGRPKGS